MGFESFSCCLFELRSNSDLQMQFQRRQEELERRARDLERREEELKNTPYNGKEEKNIAQ